MNKRGQFMAIYLVILTFLMISMVLLYYASSQEKLAGSVISPLNVLSVSDDLDIFEMKEAEVILDSVEVTGIDTEKFKEEFIFGLDQDMIEFIFEDLYWQGEVMGGDFNRQAFLENVLYSVREDSGDLILTRNEIGKKMKLEADNKSKVNFPVDFYFDFSAEYLISKSGSKYEVERV